MGLAQALVRGLSTRSGESTTLESPASWFLNWMGGGGATKAGVKIDPFSSLSISAVWACRRAISEDIAKVPLEVLREISADESEPEPNHPLHRLLNVEANPEMAAFTFRETLTDHMLGWGNGYAEIERTNSGKPLALWPMVPGRTTVRRVYDNAGQPYGRLVYDHSSEYRVARNIPAEDVLHIKGLGYDGLVGYAVTTIARESLGLTLAAERFGSAFFGNSARPSGTLNHPGKLTDPAMENLRQSWEALHAGTDNTGKTAVLREGVTWQPNSIPPNDAQFLETRQFQPVEICRWFRMPPHKIADLSRATFSNIEHQGLNYVDDTLFGWFTRWEQECRRKLFSAAERMLLFEHNADLLRRGDLLSRSQAYAVGRQWGWLTANDVLRLEGRKALPEEIGGFTLVPTNMTKPELLAQFAAMGKPGAPAADPNQARARLAVVAGAVVRAFQPALEQQFRGVLRVEVDRARRAAGQGQLKGWVEKFYEEHLDEVRGRLFPVVESLTSVLSSATDLRMEAKACVDELAKNHCEESRTTLAALAATEVETTLRGWEGPRAELAAAAAVRRLEARTELALTGTVTK